jgi:ATP-dependent exoDNAse (exonuclease V) alpha subunit
VRSSLRPHGRRSSSPPLADYVIVALPGSRLLDPSWLYTALTRARQQVIIVGQTETIREALQRPYADEQRLIGLRWRATENDDCTTLC